MAWSFSGGACKGLLEPNKAIWRTPNAAATCINLELLLTIFLVAIMVMNAPARGGFPAKLMHFPGCAVFTGAAMASHGSNSFPEPGNTTGQSSLVRQGRKMHSGPAFGWAVLRARCKHVMATAWQVQVQGSQGRAPTVSRSPRALR